MTDTDIAETLRRHADTRRRGHSVNPEVLRAAADEIERLRSECTRLAQRNAVLVCEIDDARAVRDALYRGEG